MGGGEALGILLIIGLIMMFESDRPKKKSNINIFEWLPMEDPNKSRKGRRR